MEKDDLIQQLGALRKSIEVILEIDNPFNYYIADEVTDLFVGYSRIRQYLISDDEEKFGGIPSQKMNIKTFMRDGEQVHKSSLAILLGNVNYCIELIKDDIDVKMPLNIEKKGIFLSGEYYDAFSKADSIIKSSKESIIIIDGYVDEKIIDMLTHHKGKVTVKILTKKVSPGLKRSAEAFNQQYGNLYIRENDAFHDRFLVIDESEYYHFGASLKDMGRRGFMFSKIEEDIIVDKLSSFYIEEWNKSKEVIKP